MKEYIEKQKRNEKIAIAALVFFILLIIVLFVTKNYMLGIYGFYPAVAASVAATRFSTRQRGYRLYEKNNRAELLDDIDMSAPRFQKSGIYMGSRAFYIPKSGIVFAFEDVDNLYIVETTRVVNGIIRVTREFCVHRKSFPSDSKRGLNSSIKDMRVSFSKRQAEEYAEFMTLISQIAPNVALEVPSKKNNVANRLKDLGRLLLTAVIVVAVLGIAIGVLIKVTGVTSEDFSDDDYTDETVYSAPDNGGSGNAGAPRIR